MPRTVPNLWFDDNAEDAANFYSSVFPNSKVGKITHYGPDMPLPEGTVLTVDFELDGVPYTGINGGPQFTFTEAVSFLIKCKDQDEIDYYWDALTADGGEESVCGWLKDKYGLSWQVVPADWNEDFGLNPAKDQATMQAVLQMKKLIIADLNAAADRVG